MKRKSIKVKLCPHPSVSDRCTCQSQNNNSNAKKKELFSQVIYWYHYDYKQTA
jgi:hypothetical protein